MKIKDKVEFILQNYPKTRDSDQGLITMVWWYFHSEDIISQNGKAYIDMTAIKDLEKAESITRCRRKFQEEGLFQASEAVQQQRQKFQEDMQQSMPQHGWEYADYLNQEV